MRDINRIDGYLERVKEIWKKYPDLRLGQLIINIEGQCDTPLYYMEDNKLIETLEKFYLNLGE